MNFDLLFKKAKEAGIEDLQIYLSEGNQFDIEALNGSIENYKIADSARLSVKGIYDSKMGTVSTEVITDDVIDFIIDSIVASAKTIDSEDEVFIYEGDKEYTEVTGLVNEDLNQIEAKTKINDTLNLEAKTKALDERIKMVRTFFAQTNGKVTIKNSKGLDLNKEYNNALFGIMVIASDGKDQRTSIEFKLSNDYNDFDFEAIAKQGANKALSILGAGPCDSGEYEIVLTNEASTSLLQAHVSMFSAESVQKNVSLLNGKIGHAIGSELITIVDDPFMKKSPKSGSFDDEGVATKYKELVKDGKLTGYMHNLKTAKKDNVASTGNGFGGIAPTNLYIKPGKAVKDDVIKSMKKGLIINRLEGTHSGTNAISGDFSLQASGFLVENGEIVRPVALITVAGNYLTLLQEVTEVCNDLRFGFSFIGSPSIKIKKLMVSGN